MGWLLPNHYVPWISFHTDAWASYGFVIAAAMVFLRSDRAVELHRFSAVSALVLFVPFVQHWFGLLPYSGQAWINTAFLVGFFMALMTGAHWEKIRPNQAIDGLFLAIGMAAIISVGLQLYQWLGLFIAPLDLWINGVPHDRPFANFVQPNQLATFLLWGLLGCAWGVARGKIGHRVALLLAAYLLFGVALTQSRTAFVAVIGLLVAVQWWRRLWTTNIVRWSALGLAAFYVICVLLIPTLTTQLSPDGGMSIMARSGNELRVVAYKYFFDAALNKPWWGYGWSQTAEAQLALAQTHQRLDGLFMQAHNLFLDLVLWCGIPLGGAISLFLSWWLFDKIRQVATAKNAILAMFIAVVGLHAMLELPLHYAYMLLPTGLVMGVLNHRLAEPIVAVWPRKYMVIALLMAAGLLAVITRDYSRIQEDFYVLRFERAKIGSRPSDSPHSVLVLNQMSEFIAMSNAKAKRGMTKAELDWMRKAVHAYPVAGNYFTLAVALAWNQELDEAQQQVTKLQNFASPDEYRGMRTIWQRSALTDPNLAEIRWPE